MQSPLNFDARYSLQIEQSVRQKDNIEGIKQIPLGIQPPYKWYVLILNFVLLLAAVIVNIVIGYATGGNATVSAAYPIWTTPPAYFFTIQIAIFIALIGAAIYNLVRNFWSKRAHIYFAVSNAMLIIWVCVFNVGTEICVIICFFVLMKIWPSIFLMWKQLGQIPQRQYNLGVYISRNILAFYLGWIIACTNLNFGIVIRYVWKVSNQSQMIVFWVFTSTAAIGLTVLVIFLYGRRGILSFFMFWVSACWAFAGAAITTNGCINGTISQC